MVCKNCGSHNGDNAKFCIGCGANFAEQQPANQGYNGNVQYQPANQGYVPPQQPYAAPQGYVPAAKPSGLKTAAKILMIISTVFQGLYLIPLAWCIPMTVSYSKKIKQGIPVSTGFKVCTLLFVNLISGILMLCDNED